MTVWLSLVVAALLAGNADPQVFAPKGAGFRITVPAQPEKTEQTIKTPQGSIEIRFFTVSAKEGTYVVGVTEHPEAAVPPGQDQGRLDQARDGAVATAKGRLRWEKKRTIEGRPAREFFVATETGHAVKIRLIADRNRLYQVMVVGSTRFLDSPEAIAFLDSFRLAK